MAMLRLEAFEGNGFIFEYTSGFLFNDRRDLDETWVVKGSPCHPSSGRSCENMDIYLLFVAP
jgi:hypothetical protein